MSEPSDVWAVMASKKVVGLEFKRFLNTPGTKAVNQLREATLILDTGEKVVFRAASHDHDDYELEVEVAELKGELSFKL